MRRLTILLGALVLALMLPALAYAQDAPPPQRTLALPTDQLWTLLAGALVPLVAYVLNHHAPWLTEQVKAIVQVVVAAIAGGVTQAIVAGSVGWNATTLQFVSSAVLAALIAHKVLWAPSGISAVLGGGTNAQTYTRVHKPNVTGSTNA